MLPPTLRRPFARALAVVAPAEIPARQPSTAASKPEPSTNVPGLVGYAALKAVDHAAAAVPFVFADVPRIPFMNEAPTVLTAESSLNASVMKVVLAFHFLVRVKAGANFANESG